MGPLDGAGGMRLNDGVRAVLMHGVGHIPFLEDPPAFNRLLEETIRELTASAPES